MMSPAPSITDLTAALPNLEISTQESSKYILLDPTDNADDTMEVGTFDDISSFVEEKTPLATSDDQNHWQTEHRQKLKAAFEDCWKALDACESPGRGTTKLELQNHMLVTDWTEPLPLEAAPVDNPDSKIYQAVNAYKVLHDQLESLATCVSVPWKPSTCAGAPSLQVSVDTMKQKHAFWFLLRRMIFKRLIKANERLGPFNLALEDYQAEWSDVLPLDDVPPLEDDNDAASEPDSP